MDKVGDRKGDSQRKEALGTRYERGETIGSKSRHPEQRLSQSPSLPTLWSCIPKYVLGVS